MARPLARRMTEAMLTAFSDWRELPYEQIWVVDTEFYPGPGLANGGVEGDASTPLCLVAMEMRSGRIVRLWQDELGSSPPYPLDSNTLIVSYAAAAEFGFHIACGWGEPACALDCLVEFRHYTNDGTIKAGDREKGFHSLDGALRYFLADSLDTVHKDTMRDRIIAGPPFTESEKQQIVTYCEDDVRGLARLLPHIVPTIRSLPHALLRARFQWQIAQMERRGIPVDGASLACLRRHWRGVQISLVRELDRPFGCYEIVDGVPHWRKERFADYVCRHGMGWPRHDSGALDERDSTFREMAARYPFVEPLRELRYSLSKLKLNKLAVGSDNRNRAPLWAFGTKTARCAPASSAYLFGPAKWLRFLASPAPGQALVHRDYKQQEVRIAAVLSGDSELLQACESGDVYLGIARQLGFLRDSISDDERKGVRGLFKTVVLGVQYGLGARSLAERTGITLAEAAEILARLRARFSRFEDFTRATRDYAGLHLELSNPFGWIMQCPSGINPRLLRNYPMQASGSAILQAACILADRRGIKLVAPVHDALMAEAPLDQIEDVSQSLDQLMGDAAAVVLKGYRLPTDQQIVRPGERYYDDRGEAMWNTVLRLVAELEEQAA